MSMCQAVDKITASEEWTLLLCMVQGPLRQGITTASLLCPATKDEDVGAGTNFYHFRILVTASAGSEVLLWSVSTKQCQAVTEISTKFLQRYYVTPKNNDVRLRKQNGNKLTASDGVMSRHFVVSGPAQRKCGIVASNYKEFLKKCRRKFKLKKYKEIIITLDDKTEVDEEYFEFLLDGTKLFISKSRDFETTDYIHQLASFLHACLDHQPQLHSKVMSCLREPVSSNQAVILLELMAKATDASIAQTSKEEDTEWFKGLDTRFTSKEAVMRNSAETRMRGYLDHTKRELLPEKLPADSPQNNAILFFKEKLLKAKYNASYFDRSAMSDDERLCDSQGLFECEGPYNQHKCSGIHFINPYASREARIVFSTWNFDHVIEKSRSIIPKLKAALSGPSASSVNLHYFYDLLFLHKDSSIAAKETNGNLKLVHIACHVKKPHEYQCESHKIFLDKQHDDVDGLGPQHDLQPKRHGVKRPLPNSSYYTRSKRMYASRDYCVRNGSR